MCTILVDLSILEVHLFNANTVTNCVCVCACVSVVNVCVCVRVFVHLTRPIFSVVAYSAVQFSAAS